MPPMMPDRAVLQRMAMSWTESDSRLYQELAAAAVPDRDEQMATLLTLTPLSPADTGLVVELGYRSHERMTGPPLAFAEGLAISQRTLLS